MNQSKQNQINDSVKSVMPSARRLAELTGLGKTEVNTSINRSLDVGLAKIRHKDQSISVNTKSLLEFIVYGIKYVFPVRATELVRGVPTSFAAPVMKNHLIAAGTAVPVWPDATASIMGHSVKPLYKTVPMAALNDSTLYGYLALVDAIRLGQARESTIAIKLLTQGLRG